MVVVLQAIEQRHSQIALFRIVKIDQIGLDYHPFVPF
jgi:hypothetical protein